MIETCKQNVLEVRALTRHFGRVAAVDGIDLNVRAGEIYGFLGMNGAGKTTTIRILMGIIAAQSGSISLMGEKTRRINVKQKRRIGYVSQEQNFYPWMTCKLLGKFVGSFYPAWDKHEFARLLDVFEIPADRRILQLSGGMKAKLALSLAIAPKPDLLILDEPTAGLDPVARREFMEIIVAQARQHDRTTFFSSHLIDEVERCADRIGILHSGKMRFEGALPEMQSQVRRIVAPNDLQFDVPNGFELWSERTIDGKLNQTFRATTEKWQQWVLPDGLEQQRLSLEDIFIACVAPRRIAL